MKAYQHKDNRYARGILSIKGDVMTFIAEKSKFINLPYGVNGICTKLEYTHKVVDKSFFEHFI